MPDTIDAPQSPDGQIDIFERSHVEYMVRRCLEERRPKLAAALDGMLAEHRRFVSTEGPWRLESCIEDDRPISFNPRDGGELVGDLEWLSQEADYLIRGLCDEDGGYETVALMDAPMGRMARALALVQDVAFLPEQELLG